jgi:multiple sugar transport system substrate-binding protein
MLRGRAAMWLMALAVIVAACGPSGSTTSNTTGQTIGVWTLATDTWSKYQAQMSAQFTAETGINVTFNDIPNAGWTDKLKLAQIAKNSSYDVWEGDQAFRAEYDGRNANQPLDAIISNAAKTPANFLSDFPAGAVSLCSLNGKTICLPEWGSGPLLYYNKKILSDAGFSGPPQSIADFIKIAKATKTSQIAGVCETGSTAQNITLDAYIMSQYFLPYSVGGSTIKGAFMGPDWKPQFLTPEALAFGHAYQDLLLNYGPKGVANYGPVECTRDFQQGKVAMWLDADLYVGALLDPSASTVANQVGFAEIPCPPTNPNSCMVFIGKGWFLNPNSQKQGAAWEYIKWVTSKNVTVSLVNQGKFYGGAIRASALSSVSGIPPDLTAALAYQKSHVDSLAIPAIPELIQTVIAVSDTFAKIVAGTKVEDAFAQANAKFTKILTDGGEIK